MAPSGAPWGKMSGSHLAGSDAAWPPTVAAFFAPFFRKAETGKDKIKGLKRREQMVVQ